MTAAEIPKANIEDPPEGEAFTTHEAWLDLLHAATDDGVIPIHPFTERWGWSMAAVEKFFKRLASHDHIRPHNKTEWCLIFQAQATDLVQDYEHVWRIYPKRVAKRKGLHAYTATRKGREGGPPVSALALYEATKKYAKAREGEEAEFILNPATFFGPDERWKERHTARTNSHAKGKSDKWTRPKRDLTKTRGATTKAPTPTKKRRAAPKNPTRKKDDPLADL